MTGDSGSTTPGRVDVTATGDTGRYRLEVDPARDGSLSTTLVMAAADVAEVAPEDLRPQLYDIMDPDALDALFESIHRNPHSSPVRLTFSEWGCRVTVASDGVIEMERLDPPEPQS